jgi:hypothetical protein
MHVSLVSGDYPKIHEIIWQAPCSGVVLKSVYCVMRSKTALALQDEKTWVITKQDEKEAALPPLVTHSGVCALQVFVTRRQLIRVYNRQLLVDVRASQWVTRAFYRP